MTKERFCPRFRYFSEGLKMVEHFGGYVEDLSSKLGLIASDQEKERRELVEITNTLKNSPGFNKVVSSPFLVRLLGRQN